MRLALAALAAPAAARPPLYRSPDGNTVTIELFNRWAITFNQNSLAVAAGNFLDRGQSDAHFAEQWRQFDAFCNSQAYWLNDYAMYAVLRDVYHTGAWTEWPEEVRRELWA